MQTFLPYPEFDRSAACLDRARLGKQRVETLQIINTLDRDISFAGRAAWASHPAVKMWDGYREALIRYGFAICHEWQRRGYRDNVYDQLFMLSDDPLTDDVVMPKWIGDSRLHSSHRSNLLRKDESYYRRQGWTEPTDFPYFWPTEWGYDSTTKAVSG